VVFVGSGNQDVGVWRRTLSTFVTDVPSTGAPPSDFFLKQNYPNPSNPSTRVAFRVVEYALCVAERVRMCRGGRLQHG
jgi:hypothetical protein